MVCGQHLLELHMLATRVQCNRRVVYSGFVRAVSLKTGALKMVESGETEPKDSNQNRQTAESISLRVPHYKR